MTLRCYIVSDIDCPEYKAATGVLDILGIQFMPMQRDCRGFISPYFHVLVPPASFFRNGPIPSNSLLDAGRAISSVLRYEFPLPNSFICLDALAFCRYPRPKASFHRELGLELVRDVPTALRALSLVAKPLTPQQIQSSKEPEVLQRIRYALHELRSAKQDPGLRLAKECLQRLVEERRMPPLVRNPDSFSKEELFRKLSDYLSRETAANGT